jgi:RNA polymerase sigma factor (TIGR02999 family)
MPPANEDITLLLLKAHAGEPGALDALLPQLYDELHRLARGFMRGERPDHTLQPTVLVHEAWLRLVRQDSVGFAHRAEFFSAAATVMRRILIDHARARARDKRDGGLRQPLDETVEALERNAGDLTQVGLALDELARMDPLKAKLVELRFFAGLGMREVAQVLDVHPRRAERDWTAARAWLHRRLAGTD